MSIHNIFVCVCEDELYFVKFKPERLNMIRMIYGVTVEKFVTPGFWVPGNILGIDNAVDKTVYRNTV